MTSRQLSWLVAAFFAIVVAVVFQQIATSMTQQGIASGGPYDNAASYPRAVAVFIAFLVIVQLAIDNFVRPEKLQLPGRAALLRAAGLLVIFAVYLGCLGWLGYHLTTTPMVFALMWLCGGRQVVRLLIVALVMSFATAYIFETILNVVLPGGVFGLNIPW